MSSSPDAAFEAIVRRGLDAYRAGRFFEAHELWEPGWREETDPVRKTFLHGLILVAAALHKLTEMQRPLGALRLLRKARIRLVGMPEGMGGMAIALLVDDILRAAAAIEQIASGETTELDASLLPRMEIAGDVAPSSPSGARTRP
ncbi:DUF309 domain-containing protein [Sorangium sp. So ce1000]|uniref:DUF309 domain-containing protein n=1 Tax=Sorangium sp. So ce1000 TaxID=3133325 RepID=UPI003F62E207